MGYSAMKRDARTKTTGRVADGIRNTQSRNLTGAIRRLKVRLRLTNCRRSRIDLTSVARQPIATIVTPITLDIGGCMIIEVTQADINKGRKADCRLCPIALAIKRVTGCPVEVRCHNYSKEWQHNWKQLPVVAREFILHFDRGDNTQPFQFEIED